MKKSYIFWGLAFTLLTFGFVVSIDAQTITTVGALETNPLAAKNGESFSIKLSGVDSIPTNTVTRLFINTDEGNGFTGFRDFGTWLTVGELKAGINRTMNCSAYSSYDPTGPRNITGKTLSQKLYVAYGSTGYQSEVVAHTKDCSAPVVSTGACSVSPVSATIAQNGTLSFKASSNKPSVGGDLVYVTAREFPSGIYSDFGVGKTIPVGASSVDFKVYALNAATPGSKTFKVYCTTSCPMSGCPSGGSPEVVGSATVSLTVTGINTEGGSSGGGSVGSASCSIPNVSIPANSSLYLPIDASVGSAGDVFLTGSTGPNVSVTPVHSNIKFDGGMQRGREHLAVIVRTGANFSGGDNYSLACDLPAGKSTATGVALLPAVSNPTGKMKLSQVEYLGDTMFPVSECPFGVKGCRSQFYSGDSGPKIISYLGSPALVGGDFMALYPAPAKGSITTARLFSLTDPMNPARVDSANGPSINPQYDAFGDFGPALSASAVAWSADGKYRAMVSSQGWLFVSPNGGTQVRVTRGVVGTVSIVKSGSAYILLHDRGAINITNPKDIESSGTETYDPLPANFPELDNNSQNYGDRIVSDDGLYVTVLPTDITSRFDPNFSPKVKLFSISQKAPLAELQIPSESLANGYYSASAFGRVSFSGGDYIYVFPYPGTSTGLNAKWRVDVYKIDYAAKTITQVVKFAQLPEGTISAAAGFDIGNGNVGVMIFSSFNKGGTTNPYGNYEERIKAFLFSDLAAGRVADILTNSPVSVSPETGSLVTGSGALGSGGMVGPAEVKADSFSRNGVTYVYTAANFGQNIKVWKFETGVGSSGGVNPPPSTPPTTGGGTPTYDCNFDLTFTPTNLTVKEGTYYASYTIEANSSSVNPFCTISIIPPSQNNIKSDFVNTLVVSPNGQASMLLNVSKAVKGTYTLPIKAAAKGILTKNYTVQLTIQ